MRSVLPSTVKRTPRWMVHSRNNVGEDSDAREYCTFSAKISCSTPRLTLSDSGPGCALPRWHDPIRETVGGKIDKAKKGTSGGPSTAARNQAAWPHGSWNEQTSEVRLGLETLNGENVSFGSIVCELVLSIVFPKGFHRTSVCVSLRKCAKSADIGTG